MKIHERIAFALKAADINESQASLELGRGRNWLGQAIANQSKIDADLLMPLAKMAGVTPNWLCGYEGTVSFSSEGSGSEVGTILDQIALEVQSRLLPATDAPGIEPLIRWWHRQGGLLGDFDQISNSVDLYRAPKEGAVTIEPYRIGPNSLASRSFSIKDPEEFAALLMSFPKQLNLQVLSDHVDTLRIGPKLTLEQIRVQLPHLKKTATFEYMRLLLPFHDHIGNDYILCYSRSLS